jgi:hypothetical protein
MRGSKAKELRRVLFAPAEIAEEAKLPTEAEAHIRAARRNVYRRAKRILGAEPFSLARIKHSAASAFAFIRQGALNQLAESSSPGVRNPLDDIMGA